MANTKYWFFFLVMYMAVQAKRPSKTQEQITEVYSNLRNLTTMIITNPIVNGIVQALADISVDIVQDLSALPLSLANTTGFGLDHPNIINENNLEHYTDEFFKQFHFDVGHPDATLSLEKLIKKYGYPLEIHDVVTEDGYILGVYRIPKHGPSVLLVHGQMGSGDDFVVAGPESGLAYLLWQDGFDVWITNSRGNKHSRRHIKMKPSEARFWDFTWHEIGYYDVPSTIDYILNVTNEKKLKFVGHSQGNTVFYVMTSLKPEYNEKVSLMLALAPSAFVSKLRTPLARAMAPATGVLHAVMKYFGIYEYMPDTPTLRVIKTLMCGINPFTEVLCATVLMFSFGLSFENLNVTNMPVLLGHEPSGCSMKQMIHFGQILVSGQFRQFDYGARQNLLKYGSKNPPSYPLEKVTAPVALFYSDTDMMSHPDDVHILNYTLKNVVELYKVPKQPFNHLDFLWGNNFKTMIYKKLIQLLRIY